MTSLQGLNAYGGVVLPGTYTLSRPIYLQGLTGVDLIGMNATVVADPKQPTNSWQTGDTLTLRDCHHVRISGFGFDGNRLARGGFNGAPSTVQLISCSHVTIDHCRFTGAVCDSVFVWGGLNPKSSDPVCRNILIDSCYFSDPGRNCVSLVGAKFATVSNCHFEGPGGNPGVAVDVEPNEGDPDGVVSNVIISNNQARNINGAFYVIPKTGCNVFGAVVCGNQIDNTAWDGIANYGTSTLIYGNTVTNPKRMGISNFGSMIQFGNNATIFQPQ